MKKSLLLLVLGTSFIFASCTKSDNDKNSSQNDKKEEPVELTVLATADLKMLDEGNKELSFKGYQKKGAYLDASGHVGGTILDQKFLDLHFQDVDKNEIVIKLHLDEAVKTGTYAVQDKDNSLLFTLFYNENQYNMMNYMDVLGEYKEEPIQLNGQVTIDKLTETHISGTFYFDAYDRTYSKKIEIKKGEFNAEILRYNN